MNLYLVSRTTEPVRDDLVCFVVAAESETAARTTDISSAGFWNVSFDETTARLIGIADPSLKSGEIICADTWEG